MLRHGAARRRGSAQAESTLAVRLLWHGAARRRGSAQAESTLAVRLLWHGAARRRGSAPLPRFRQRLAHCLAQRSEGTPSPPNLPCGFARPWLSRIQTPPSRHGTEIRQAMKFGVIYQSFDPPPVFLDYVRAIENLGFDDLWVCDSSLHARDVFAYLTLAAVNTTRVRLGVSVFQPYTRHPAIDVNGMATINEISGGRVSMAVGAGDRPQLELGFKPAPVRLVRDMIQVCRQLIAGETVSFDNQQFRL